MTIKGRATEDPQRNLIYDSENINTSMKPQERIHCIGQLVKNESTRRYKQHNGRTKYSPLNYNCKC